VGGQFVRRLRRLLGVLAAVAAAVPLGPLPVAAATPGPIPVQLLAINDLHGRIDLTTGNESRLVTGPGPDGVYGKNASGESDDDVSRVGGAANVATTVHERQQNFRAVAGGSAASFLVAAGDLIGSSPPVSGNYADEPSIEVANALGIDVSAVGDDEFSRGTQQLRRLSAATDGQFTDDVTACQGVTPGADGCFGQGEHAFTGARFPYLAANVVSASTGQPILPPYQVFYTPTGVRVGMIGVVTQLTPTQVPPEGIADVRFTDEATAVNRSVRELQAQGVQSIVVLMHDGGGTAGPAALDPNGCDQLSGPIIGLNEQIDPAVDVIVSGYTHAAYICALPVPRGAPRLVTQAGSYGELVTDIRLTLNPTTGDVDRAATYAAANVPVLRTNPDERVHGIVDYWTAGPAHQPAAGSEAAAPPAGGNTAAPATPSRAMGWTVFWIGVLTLVALGAVVWLRMRRNPSR
jgi:5'-nucleotidase